MGELTMYKSRVVGSAILSGASSEGILHLPAEGREEHVRILVLYLGI